MRIRRRFYGWKSSDIKTYASIFNRFGGSINAHPDVIQFISEKRSENVQFFHKEKAGEIIAAYALMENNILAVKAWTQYPLSYDEVMLPISPGSRFLFPEKTNRLSNLHKKNVFNSTFSIARKNKICIVKESFSAKNEKNRRNEYQKFIRHGGCCLELTQFSSEEIADYYITLFTSRFAGIVECYSRDDLIEIINRLRHMLFGKILFIHDEPCAMDLIFMAESQLGIYFDVPNGGINSKFSHLSPGSLIMWKNINAARELCLNKGKNMRFSIGLLKKEWRYKLRWADAFSTGKTLY